MLARRTARSLCLLLTGLGTTGLLIALLGTGAEAARSPTPAADCQPFAQSPCLLPFPNNLFTVPDRTTPTGLRVHLPAAAMPASTKGQRISVSEYDRNDGFSPGSAVIVHVPGLDNMRAFQRTGVVGLLDMSRAFAKRQPIVILDEQSGRRQLIWSELDANATSPGSTDLLIHPGKNFTEGHTYVVALRNLRTAGGRTIPAPNWFARLRDRRVLPARERSQRARYARIFQTLAGAGIARPSLYEAWDFTIASRQSLTSRLLAIRDDAFAQLGDRNLADGKVEGRASAYTITSTANLTSQIQSVQGTFTVPCYLITCGSAATTGFHYGSRNADALPRQLPGNLATAPFECIIPSSAGNPTPARLVLYGHGLLGSHREVEKPNVQAMATEHNMVFCATDWWGLAGADVPFDAGASGNLNLFPVVVDRLQQGVLNTLYLGRLMIHSAGLASDPAFRTPGRPVIDTSNLFYDGNSQGGIEGGMTTAVAPDFRRATLGVSGMNYGDVLVQRSTDFAPFAAILRTNYPDQSQYPVILDVMQQLWDRGDPDGYAQHMTSNPLPDTPSHAVLMQIAYGDHQVSNYSAAIEARTIGAAVHGPALDLNTNRVRDHNLFYRVPVIGHYPFPGSAIVIWDAGPGLVQPPPIGNIAPADTANNHDPHEFVRDSPAARQQKSDFLQATGSVVDVCAGKPCHTYNYTP